MPRGDKSSYTKKQRRQAEHIEETYEKRGASKKKAARIAYATVNKQDGGGKKSGSGRKKSSGTSKAKTKKAKTKSASRKSASKTKTKSSSKKKKS